MDLYTGVLLSLLASVSWGLTAIFIKNGVQNIDPFLALFIRAIIGGPLLIIVALLFNFDLSVYFNPELFPLLLFSSLIIVVGDGLFIFALQRYSVTVMQPIASIYPLITTFLLIISRTEQIGIFVMIGTPVIVIGIIIVTASDKGEQNKFEFNALALGLLVAVFWGSAIYMVRLLLIASGTEPFGLTGVRVSFIAIGAIITYIIKPKNKLFGRPDKRSIKYLILSGITGFAIGASALFVAQEGIGAAITTPVSSTNPIFVLIFSLLLGKELINRSKLIGTIISVLGIIIIVLQ